MVEVTLLTQENCAFCEQAKELLERLSKEYGFAVSTVDLSTPEGKTLAWQGGILLPPGIFMDGQPFSYGRLSEPKLRRELERRSSRRGEEDNVE